MFQTDPADLTERYVHPHAYARLDQSNQIQFLKCCVVMVGSLIQCVGGRILYIVNASCG